MMCGRCDNILFPIHRTAILKTTQLLIHSNRCQHRVAMSLCLVSLISNDIEMSLVYLPAASDVLSFSPTFFLI